VLKHVIISLTQDNAEKENSKVISDNHTFDEEPIGYQIEMQRRYQKDPTQV